MKGGKGVEEGGGKDGGREQGRKERREERNEGKDGEKGGREAPRKGEKKEVEGKKGRKRRREQGTEGEESGCFQIIASCSLRRKILVPYSKSQADPEPPDVKYSSSGPCPPIIIPLIHPSLSL